MFYWLFELEKKNKKLYKFYYYIIVIGIPSAISVVVAIITNIVLKLF